uniref:Secreted protein n=1 Tax=Ascaris lumbricoides TaxID=6252 RepID=A0A0M3IN58_ASCLU
MRSIIFIFWLNTINLCRVEALVVSINQPCDVNHDILLMDDTNGNGNSYLRCRSLGIG